MIAGFARVDITPDTEHEAVFGLGYWNERSIRFKGVRDRLYVRAAVLGEGAEMLVLVGIDSLMDSYGFSPRAAARLSAEFGIAPDRIWIACSHAHSTPVIGLNRTDEGAEYGLRVADAIAEAAASAAAHQVETGVTVSEVQVPGVLYNRRPLVSGGRVAELHVMPDPDAVADAGLTDETMTVIQFRDSAGSLAGAWCHFGIHGVCIQCSDLVSGDCTGRFLQRMESDLGGSAVIGFLNGACGDVDPSAMGGEEALEKTAGLLYDGLLRAFEQPGTAIRTVPTACTALKYTARRRAARSVEECEEAKAAAALPSPDAPARHHSGPEYEKFLIEEEQLLSRLPPTIDIHCQAWRIGDLVLVGAGGEVFAESGKWLQNALAPMKVLVVGCTGGWQGYLPPLRSYAQGGYEVVPSLWSRIEPGETEGLLEALRDAAAGL